MATRNKPLPASERHLTGKSINRGEQVSRTNDTTNNVSVGLSDIDWAIMYYFNEVIKPSVIDNGEKVNVPVIYANPERWKAMQQDGYIRDNKQNVILPVIAFRRTGFEKNEDMPVDKLDANDPQLFYTFERRYTKENRYDQFSVLTGTLPSREYYMVAMPDYVTLNYECVIQTTYTAQMNGITEKINFSDGAYWGEPAKFKFRNQITSFEDGSEQGDGERIIKTTFNMTVYGYLIPESFNEFIATKKRFSPTGTVVKFSV